MNYEFTKTLEEKDSDVKVVFIFKDTSLEIFPEDVKKQFSNSVERKAFSYKKGCTKIFSHKEEPFMVVGLGENSSKFTEEDLRYAVHGFAKKMRAENFKSASVHFDDSSLSRSVIYKIFVEMLETSLYKFEWYKKDYKKAALENVYIADISANQGAIEGIKEGQILAQAVLTCKSLVDEPANVIYPETLAKHVQKLGKESGFEVEVFEKDKIEKFGMHAFLNVARGSARKPKLIVMRYFGAGNKDEINGLVGKGLTYDTGGYSIKPSNGMLTMKCDMGGAASVIGAMEAIAKSKLTVNVVAVVASCENNISGEAYYPGDIIDSMAGKKIFVGNTDAEGRLTLVDAITYIIKHEKVDNIVDFATLTGAATVAFGSACAAVVGRDDDFVAEYEKAAKIAGEKAWRMPIFEEYEELLKHDTADLTNSAGAPGTITAGLFLGEFVEGKPWVHVDIAPTSYIDKPSGFYDKGATGYGSKTIFELMKSRIK